MKPKEETKARQVRTMEKWQTVYAKKLREPSSNGSSFLSQVNEERKKKKKEENSLPKSRCCDLNAERNETGVSLD